VTYAQIDAWPIKPVTFLSAKDQVYRTVHARTVKWVKEQLLGVNIYHEWITSAPDDVPIQSQALDRIIANLRKPLGSLGSPDKGAPEFEVVNQGEVWILGTKGDPEFPAEADAPGKTAEKADAKAADMTAIKTAGQTTSDDKAGGSELAQEVAEFLAEHKVESAAAALLLLGVQAVEDISYLKDQALENAGLNQVQVGKLRHALALPTSAASPAAAASPAVAPPAPPAAGSGCCAVS